jgi:predicted dehydrogenase
MIPVEIRVGIVGTSWWTDAMYLPALADHPAASVVALCGRTESTARELADRWGIGAVFTDWREMLASGSVDAVIVATPNDTHYEITMAALALGIAVLCDKPIATNAADALAMADAANRAGVTTMVPFTYRYMPNHQLVKRLVEGGEIGTPRHLNLRYYTGYAREGSYAWRFDQERAGSGVIGDLGSHWIDLARWLLGEVVAVSATALHHVEREPRPDGTPYTPTEDHGIILTRHVGGAVAILEVSAVATEGSPFGQKHQLDLHGTDGSIESVNDWDSVQEVRLLRRSSPGLHEIVPFPPDLVDGLPMHHVGDTYRAVFRRTNTMTRAWATAVAHGELCSPDLSDGAQVQVVLDAALASVAAGSAWQTISLP